MNYSRRTFLRQTSAASALLLLSPQRFLAPRAKQMIGLQLYTLKEDASKDIEATLRHITEVGYDNVELFGYNNRHYFGKTISEMKALLNNFKLASTSGHYALSDFLFNKNDDELKYVIEDGKTLGHKFITVPWLAEDKRTLDNYKMLAERFNVAGAMCSQAGLRFAYHNHDFEFNKLGDTTGYEVLLSQTDDKLVSFEMDLYWVIAAGYKPADLFERYPGRFPMWHVKDMAAEGKKESTEIGKGTINFKDIFAQRQKAGLQNFFVEQEEFGKETPAQAIETSYQYIKTNLV